MDIGFGLVLVTIVCILGHLATAWWFSYVLTGRATDIDARIEAIDNGLGWLGQKLLDPEHWQELISTVSPQPQNVGAMVVEALFKNLSAQDSPNDIYGRNDDGTFNGTQTLKEITPKTHEGDQS
jgi:hypothetical protein